METMYAETEIARTDQGTGRHGKKKLLPYETRKANETYLNNVCGRRDSDIGIISIKSIVRYAMCFRN